MELEILQFLNYEKQKILFYLKEVVKLGYKKTEIQILFERLEFVEKLLSELTFMSLKTLLATSSNRRLKTIISGENLLIDIINIPFDYMLVIDMDNIDDIDISNALVFKSLNRKYCMFKHKNFCNQGLTYIQGKWQKV